VTWSSALVTLRDVSTSVTFHPKDRPELIPEFLIYLVPSRAQEIFALFFTSFKILQEAAQTWKCGTTFSTLNLIWFQSQ
jgi:hypothetical protein